MERTLAIVKPDAVRRNLTGEILKRIESSELKIVGLRRIQLSRADAERFYEVHQAKPFFKGLCDYMTSGPVVVAVLQGEGAITKWRQLMGATDPKKADPGTIRKDFGIDREPFNRRSPGAALTFEARLKRDRILQGRHVARL